MTPETIISMARREGVRLSADGDKLRLVFESQPSPELLNALKVSKPQVLAELHRLQELWLERVARIVKRPAFWLLEHDIVDVNDMQEQWHTEPRQAAKLLANRYRF